MPDVFSLKPRMVPAPIGFLKVIRTGDLARQKSTADRAVRDQAYTKLAKNRQDSLLDISRPQRILRLHRRYRMHFMRTTNRAWARFGQADVADLAFFHERGHCCNSVFDRGVRIDAVLVVEV